MAKSKTAGDLMLAERTRGNVTATPFKNRIVGEGEESPSNLLANPSNFRRHPVAQFKALEGVLDEVGWIQRVIVNKATGNIVDGHARVELAIRRSEPTIPVLYVELTENEEKLILATLDPITGLAFHDDQMLADLLAEIETDNESVAEFLATLANSEDSGEPKEGLSDPDEIPEQQAKVVTKAGDVWTMGDHRLICGDSTDRAVIERVCENKRVDMVWTDPPYNVAYVGKTKKSLKIQNDDMGSDDFVAFVTAAFASASAVLNEGGGFYVAHATSTGPQMLSGIEAAGLVVKQTLVWVKNQFVLGRQDYQWQHEPIFYGWKPGAAHKWYGDFDKKTVIDTEQDPKKMNKEELVQLVKELRNGRLTSVIREDRPSSSQDHPTMKPIALIEHMMRNSSTIGDTVLDIFGGSGGTMIAAERNRRKARLVELEPGYCDVIIRRYQAFTGRMAWRSDGVSFDDLQGKCDG